MSRAKSRKNKISDSNAQHAYASDKNSKSVKERIEKNLPERSKNKKIFFGHPSDCRHC